LNFYVIIINVIFLFLEVELKAQDNPEIAVIINEESVCQSKNAQSNVLFF